MVILSYYVSGIIATFMLFIFHNLIVSNPQKEFTVAQMLVSAFVWPIVIPLAAIAGVSHYGGQSIRWIRYLFKSTK